MMLNEFNNLIGGKVRFTKISGRSELQTLFLGFVGYFAIGESNNDYLRMKFGLLVLFQKLHPTHIRHEHIKQNQVWLERFGQFKP